MATKRNLVASRERARQTMAARREALLNREKENEADLAEFFKQDEVIASAKAERDAAIAKAEKRFTEATDAAEASSAQAVRRLKERGESVDSLNELTGLDRTEIRRLLRLAPAAVEAAEKPLAHAQANEPSSSDGESAESETVEVPVLAVSVS